MFKLIKHTYTEDEVKLFVNQVTELTSQKKQESLPLIDYCVRKKLIQCVVFLVSVCKVTVPEPRKCAQIQKQSTVPAFQDFQRPSQRNGPLVKEKHPNTRVSKSLCGRVKARRNPGDINDELPHESRLQVYEPAQVHHDTFDTF